MKRFHYLAGLARSGSTVLGAMLSQDPRIHVSATSPLPVLLSGIADVAGKCLAARATMRPEQLPAVYRGIGDALYAHVDKPIVIDKSRMWPGVFSQPDSPIAIFAGKEPRILLHRAPVRRDRGIDDPAEPQSGPRRQAGCDHGDADEPRHRADGR